MDLSDKALLENYRKTKDSQFIVSLFRRYQTRIYNAAYRVCGSAEEAEEVVQETYIKIHENLGQIRNHRGIVTWIFRSVHNSCWDILRAKKRRKEFHGATSDRDGDDFPDANQYAINQALDQRPNPAENLDLSEQAQYVQASLAQLPEAQRIVVVLHDIEGFQYEEIAQIVGTNIGTVRSRIYYARIKLRELLEPYLRQADLPSPLR